MVTTEQPATATNKNVTVDAKQQFTSMIQKALSQDETSATLSDTSGEQASSADEPATTDEDLPVDELTAASAFIWPTPVSDQQSVGVKDGLLEAGDADVQIKTDMGTQRAGNETISTPLRQAQSETVAPSLTKSDTPTAVDTKSMTRHEGEATKLTPVTQNMASTVLDDPLSFTIVATPHEDTLATILPPDQPMANDGLSLPKTEVNALISDQPPTIKADQLKSEPIMTINLQVTTPTAPGEMQTVTLDQVAETKVVQKVVALAKQVEIQKEPQQLVLKLNPESLGKVEVKMTWTNDSLNVQFKMEHAQTKALFETVAHKFQEAMGTNYTTKEVATPVMTPTKVDVLPSEFPLLNQMQSGAFSQQHAQHQKQQSRQRVGTIRRSQNELPEFEVQTVDSKDNISILV